MSTTNRQWLLASRPVGMVTEANFEFRESPLPEPAEGEVLIRNLYVSFDPAMRGWMEDRESYLPPVAIGVAVPAPTSTRGATPVGIDSLFKRRRSGASSVAP